MSRVRKTLIRLDQPIGVRPAARDEDQVDPATHNAFGDASWMPVACVSCNGEPFLAGVVVTDLDTEHGGTDANKRHGVRRVGRLNVADLDL
jgi:hypothetical protein